MNGFLIVNKPLGPTSHDVVARVRRLVGRGIKVGHTGTLDPQAGGVLPIAVGHATRLADELRDADKAYRGIIRLGIVTDSDDAAGAVIAERAVEPIAVEQLEHILAQFRGPLRQMPPAYSAIHVNGQRAYDLARRGEQPELAARDVVIHQLSGRLIDERHIAIDVSCSKGTYIRALARDIGAALGCGGHLAELQRTQVGPFTLGEAVALDQLSTRDDVITRLVPLQRVLQRWTAVTLTDDQCRRVMHGMPVQLETTARQVAAYRKPDELLALLEHVGAYWQPRKVFVQD